jgi:hypothetical protein
MTKVAQKATATKPDKSAVYVINDFVELGYISHMVPLVEGEKRPMDGGWQRHKTTEADLPRFKGSIGMRCEPNDGSQGLVILDVDVTDPDIAREMWAKIAGQYPNIPKRVGQAPKFAVIFRHDGTETTLQQKRRIPVRGGHQIEVLARGQQLAVAGTHPATGKPFYFTQPLLHRDELPEITREELNGLLDELVADHLVVDDDGSDEDGNATMRDLSHLDEETREFVEGLQDYIAWGSQDIIRNLHRRENRLDYDAFFAVVVAIRDCFKGTCLDAYAKSALDDFVGRWIDPKPGEGRPDPADLREKDQQKLDTLWAEEPCDGGYTMRTVQRYLGEMPERDAEAPTVSIYDEDRYIEDPEDTSVPLQKLDSLGFWTAPLPELDEQQAAWVRGAIRIFAKGLLPQLSGRPADEQLDVLYRVSSKELNKALEKDGYQGIEQGELEAIAIDAVADLVPEDDTAPEMPDLPPGLAGKIAADVLPRLRFKQPSIAIATGLMAVSRLSDHQFIVEAPTGQQTALNLYGLVAASTGVGKDTVATYIDNLGIAVGNESLVGASMASPPAMARVLGKKPATAHLIVMDEIGKKLEFAASGSGAHEAAVLATAMEMYGRALSVFSGREYAQEKQSVGEVEMPYLCIVGMSTPEALKKSLTTGAVFDGFLNRLEYFPDVGDLTRNEEQSFGAIPENITKPCRELWSGSDRSRWVDTRRLGDASIQSTGYKVRGHEFWVIRMTEEAHRLFDEFDRSHDIHRQRGGAKGALLGRATERAIRIAGLLAIEGACESQLTVEHAKWAIAWVRFSVHQMLQFVGDGLAAPDYASLVAEIEAFCRDAIGDPGSAPCTKDRPQWKAHLRRGLIAQSHITRKFKHAKKHDRDAAIETLIEAGVLEVEEERPASGGTAMKLYKIR